MERCRNPPLEPPALRGDARHAAPRRRASTASSPARARSACSRAAARPTSRSSCATAAARSRRACSATPTSTAGASSAASWCACAGRVVRFREQTQIELDRIERAAGGEARPGGVPARRLPRPRRARRLPRAPRARGRRSRLPRACSSAMLGDARAARASCAAPPCTRAGHHAYLGGLLEHTVAVATLAQELALGHPRLNSRPADVRGDRPRHRQDARVHLRRRRSSSARRAGCSATSRSACGSCASAPAACSTSGGCSRSSTACSATTAPTPRRAGASRASRRSRCTGSTRSTRAVKGALEHGLPRAPSAPAAR